MALHVPRAPGFSSMMKDGARFFSGLEEAVIRNIGKAFYYNNCELNCTITQFFSNGNRFILCIFIIDACKEFSNTVSTAYGPNGMNKMVINHLEKLFVTNDAATIIRELEVEHPAAKMMILGSQMMEQEVSNGQLILYGVYGI